MKRIHIRSFCLSALDETRSGWVISFEGSRIKFAKL